MNAVKNEDSPPGHILFHWNYSTQAYKKIHLQMLPFQTASLKANV